MCVINNFYYIWDSFKIRENNVYTMYIQSYDNIKS